MKASLSMSVGISVGKMTKWVLLGNIIGMATGYKLSSLPAPTTADTCSKDGDEEGSFKFCSSTVHKCTVDCGKDYAWEVIKHARQGSMVSTALLTFGLAAIMLAVSCLVSSRLLRLVLYFSFSIFFYCFIVVTVPQIRSFAHGQLVKMDIKAPSSPSAT